MEEKYKNYIKELEMENENLRSQLKVVEEDRDESKLALGNILGKYLELYAEKNGIDKKDLLNEIGQNMKKIME